MMDKETARGVVADLVERFRNQREYLVRGDSDYNETELRNDFLNPFLRALGWDVFNEKGAVQHLRDVVHEAKVEVPPDEGEEEALAKRPDYSMRAGGVRKFFLEAKKPSVRIEAHNASAFQIRRYGWSAGLPISVLSNFDKLCIYDCRPMPQADDNAQIARITEYDFSEYLDKFDEIYDQISCDFVYSGKFDERYALAEEFASSTFDQYFLKQIEKWRSILATDLQHRNRDLTEEELNFLVPRLINRILFLRICEDRALEKYKALQEVSSYGELKELFERADKRYNSGLFDFIEDALSLSIEVGNEALIGVFKELYYPQSPYDFSVVESGLLGEVYELFLAKRIQLRAEGTDARVSVVEKAEIRESGGVVSTPPYIAAQIVEKVVGSKVRGLTPNEVSNLRIVDLSCGSGTFVLAAFEFLQRFHIEWYLNDGPDKYPEQIYRGINDDWYLTLPEKRRILLNNIYAVDIDIQAVEVTQFSLLLKTLETTSNGEVSAYIEYFKEEALPNLDRNIQCGNSLVDNSYFNFRPIELNGLDELRAINVFDFADHFPEVMEEGGFDIILGNPPYIRIQNMVRYSRPEVTYYQSNFSPYTTAKADNFDKYSLFIERAITLLKPNGTLGYIVPHKFTVTRAGGALRSLIATGRHLSDFIHFGTIQVFGATVTTYVCVLVLNRAGCNEFQFERVTDLNAWRYGTKGQQSTHASTEISDEPWSFANQTVTRLFERIRQENTVPLDQVAEIFVGVQTSADKTYIIRPTDQDDNYVYFTDREGVARSIEEGIVRPCLQKVQFKDFGKAQSNAFIIFPYRIQDGAAVLLSLEDLEADFPRAFEYLNANRERLAQRNAPNLNDANWFQFGRSQSLTKFNGEAKIIWSTLLHEPRYIYDDSNVVFTGGGNGPYYGLRPKADLENPISIFYIQAILHHPIIDAMVAGSSFRGDYVSHGKQFIAKLPIKVIDQGDAAQVALYERVIALTQLLNDTAARAYAATLPNQRRILVRQVTALRRSMTEVIDRIYGFTAEDLRAIQAQNE